MAAAVIISTFAIAFGLFCFFVWVKAIMEIANATFSDESATKVLWLLLVIFLPFIGSICWFFAGRSMRTYIREEEPINLNYKRDLV